MSDPPELSVVVPTRDRPEALARCLRALGRQDAAGLEVVVVDDASRDRDALSRALSALPETRLVRAPGRGPAAARNLGIRAAQSPVVCLTDDDCEPDPGWARQLGAQAAEGVAVAGLTVPPPETSVPVRASQAITNYLLTASRAADGSIGFAPTCNMAAPRDLFARLPFDASYPAAAGEDRDWWERLIATGERGAYAPGATVVHHQQFTLRSFWRQQLRYGRGAARFRHTDRASRRLAGPGFYAGLLRAGFAAGAAAGTLVAVAQLATAAGVVAERRALRAAASPRD